MGRLDLKEKYGDRADDGARIDDALAALDRADNELLSAEMHLNALGRWDEDGDLTQTEAADIAHEIKRARRAIRNLARIVQAHDADLQALASEEADHG